jgi:hypothetical protein
MFGISVHMLSNVFMINDQVQVSAGQGKQLCHAEELWQSCCIWAAQETMFWTERAISLNAA